MNGLIFRKPNGDVDYFKKTSKYAQFFQVSRTPNVPDKLALFVGGGEEELSPLRL